MRIFNLFAIFILLFNYCFATTAGENYILRSRDLIRLSVYQEPDMHTEARITAEGNVLLPLIGNVKAAGLTLHQLQQRVTQLYNKDFLVDPQITIFISEYAPRRIHVLGQVNRPGEVLIPAEESITLSKAISGAMGFTRLADQSNVSLKRIVNGKEEQSTHDVEKIMNRTGAFDIPLEDGDIVYVKESIF